MWRSLNHSYVLPFLGIYKDDATSFLVSPYMKNGTLAQWRQKANPSIEAIEERVCLFFILLITKLTLLERCWKSLEAWNTFIQKG